MIMNLPANTGDAGLIPGLGTSPEEGNSNLLQYSCLEIPMARGAWWATAHGVTKELDTTERLSMHSYMYMCVCVCICIYIYKVLHKIIISSIILYLHTIHIIYYIQALYDILFLLCY